MGRIGDQAYDTRWHPIDVEGSPGQVYPPGLIAGAPELTCFHVDCSRELRSGERLANGCPIFVHNVCEGHFEVPEWLHSGLAEDLVMPNGAMHRAVRQVKLPTAHAGRIQGHLQKLSGICRLGSHKRL